MKYWRKEQAAENNGVHIVEVTVSSKADTITIPHGLSAAPSKVILREKTNGSAGEYAPYFIASHLYHVDSTNYQYFDISACRGYISSTNNPVLNYAARQATGTPKPYVNIDGSNITLKTQSTTYYFQAGAVYELLMFE